MQKMFAKLRQQFAKSAPTGADLEQQIRDRLLLTMVAVLGLFAIVQARLVYLGSQENRGYVAQHAADVALAASRPRILDRNGQIMALDIQMQSLFAEPKLIENPDEIYEALITVLPDLDFDVTMKRLKNGAGFVWLRREITPAQQQQILALVSFSVRYPWHLADQ